MTQTSIFPYFLIMSLLFSLASLFSRSSDFYRKAVEKSSKSYYQSLDGLRGILALGVFFHHSVMNYYYFETGYFGNTFSRFYDFLGEAAVALFFMITGFLFWSKAIREKLSISRFELKRFYWNRLLRIYPLYLLSLALVILIVVLTSYTSVKDINISNLIYELFRLSTLLSAVFINGSHGPTSVNSVSIVPINSGVQWTLVYEIQFYLILPFLAFFSKPRRFVVLAGAVLAFYAFHPSRHIAITINFLCGMLAAYIVNIISTKQLKVNNRLTSSTVLFLLLILILFSSGDYLTNPIASTLLFTIFILIASGNTFFNLLSQPFSRYLGIVSYSIYLLHGIILFTVFHVVNLVYPIKNLSGESFWLLTLIAGSLAIVISGFTYRFVEHPFLPIKASTVDSFKSE